MNNKIEPTYVTFEQAKCLKEKGFNYHELFNDFADYYDYYDRTVQGRLHVSDFPDNKYPDDDWIAVPEQWQVVEWLFLKHRLDIIVKYPESNTNKIEGINSVYYDLEIYKLQGGDAYKVYKFIGISDKKQVAYSKAFDYILNNNLI